MKREILKNGAEITAKCKCREIGYVVLARKKKNNINNVWEFITWLTDDKLNCFHGNYFSDIEKARRNYWDRVMTHCATNHIPC